MRLQPIILAFCCLVISTLRVAIAQPNIIFILADDWGWTDWQQNGQTTGSSFYETPNLNTLAQQGMSFSQAYAQPLCSPSRAALMTGKYPGARLHMHQAITGKSVPEPTLAATCSNNKKTCYPSNRNHLPLNEITIAEELKKAGYKTFHFGKWHLGQKNFFPNKQGFDKQFAVGGAGPGPGGYFAPYKRLADIPQGPDGEYLTERLTNEVMKTLEAVKDERFFIYFSHYNVHAPYQAKAELISKYEKKAGANNHHRHPIMAAMIESLDNSVGKILNKLDKLKIADNTMLIVMGDNGGIHWNNDKGKYKNVPVTSNAPLRCGKACFYEGGVRVPLLVRYPKLVKKNTIENTPVHLIDFYPTLLALAGVKASKQKDVVDGISILPLLSGSGALPKRPIFTHFPRKKQVGVPVGGSSVRLGKYKLYRLYGFNDDASDKYELYDLAVDIQERNDLAATLPKIRNSMISLLDEWLDDTGALVPHPTPEWIGAVKLKTDTQTM